MMVVSLDHSPQEIPNERDIWHTSALLASVSAEQWGWDESLGPLLSPQSGKLQKWAGRRAGRYRREFRRLFPQTLAQSGVFALALSVQGGTVVDFLPELLGQLGLDQNILVSGNEAAVVGLKCGQDFKISTVQAAYAVYLVHYICRMHDLVLQSHLENGGEIHGFLDWQISPDNFPAGVNGPMAKLFSVMANSAGPLGLVCGNLRVSTHYVAGDPGTDVCDNLAGMLKDDLPGALKHGLITMDNTVLYLERPKAGGLYWEIHSRVQNP